MPLPNKMNSEITWWENWTRRVLRFRIPILIAALGVTVFLAFQGSRLRSGWNEQTELSANDPELAYFQQFLERFGGQEYLLVLLQGDELFSPEGLAYLQQLTDSLWEVPHVVDVVSLATIPICRGEGANARMEALYTEPPATREESVRLQSEALNNPLWVGSLVSADGRTACINVMLPSLSHQVTDRLDSVAAVEEILQQNSNPLLEVSFTGLSPMASDMQVALQGDLIRFLILTPILVLVCLFWAFRTGRGMWVPALVISMAVIWAMGLLGLSGGSLNICTVMLPTLVAVNALSYSIHLLNGVHESCARGGEYRNILIWTLAHLAPPIWIAAVTTAMGFGALLFAELRSLRELGLFSAIGILLAVLLCMTLVPILLSWLPLPARAAHRHARVRSLRWALWQVASFVNRDRWKIPAVLILLIGLSVVGIRHIRVETQWAHYLPDSAPSIHTLQVVEENLAGFHVLELELDGPEGTFHEPWALRELDQLQLMLAAWPQVDKTMSAVDLVRELHQARNPAASQGKPATLPSSSGELAEIRLLYSMAGQGGMMDAFLTEDGSAARLSLRLPSMTTAEQLQLLNRIDDAADQMLDSRLTLHSTGVVKLFAAKLHALVRSLMKSFALSFLLIAGVLSIQLRSIRAGLCSMIPNVLPVLLGFGLMGALGIPLSASTVMIASVGIGIAVDDTIHMLLRYRHELQAGRSPKSAVRRTLLGTGRAVVFSSIGLAAGFTVLAFSRFSLNREFGLLTAFIMLAALLTDLFVTPYLLRALRLFRKDPS